MTFQSTLPTRGSDVGMLAQSVSASSFNPRSPRGGATSVVCAPEQLNQVSIHAPHEGERLGQIFLSVLLDKVSIHAPHEGERHILLRAPFCPWRFNPRSPRGGATHHLQHRQMISKFQSTLPTRGSDAYAHVLALTHQLFQSTLPTRGSDFQRYPLIQPQPAVSIHAPHEGERPAFSAAAFSDKSFNPRSP